MASFAAASADSGQNYCIICISEQHPLYACPKFRAMSHDVKLSTLKQNNLCLNCFSSGHFVKQCKSAHRCRKCQRPHHTLLHLETQSDASHQTPHQSSQSMDHLPTSQVVSHTAVKLRSSSLLMTCRILVFGSDGLPVKVRALLDNGFTSSFVSACLVQSLRLPRSQHWIQVSGISGSSASSPVHSFASFQISFPHVNGKKIDLTAIVLPRVTCDLPVSTVSFDLSQTHLSGLPLAVPSFGEPQRVDVQHGIDIFVDILHQGQRTGPIGSPLTIETESVWVLCGCSTSSGDVNLHVTSHYAATVCIDDLSRKFLDTEESSSDLPILTLEEHSVLQDFEINHSHTRAGRFVVPLPKKPNAETLVESRSQAVRDSSH